MLSMAITCKSPEKIPRIILEKIPLKNRSGQKKCPLPLVYKRLPVWYIRLT